MHLYIIYHTNILCNKVIYLNIINIYIYIYVTGWQYLEI